MQTGSEGRGQLLSVEASSSCQDFVAWSEAEKKTIAVQLEGLVEAWLADWRPFPRKTPKGTAVVRSATGDQLEPELAGISLADAGLAEFRGRVHRLWQVPGVAGFEAALFGYTLAVTALQTRSFVEKASSDWWQRLCGWLRIVSLDSNTSADSQTLPVEFSGVLRCEVFIGDQSLAFDLPATTVSQLLAGADARRPFQAGAPIVGQTKLEPLLSALTSQVVALECCLDGLSMSLDQLGALQVNDILLLEHKLDSPLTLQLEDHSILGKGWLGRAGTGLALELCS